MKIDEIIAGPGWLTLYRGEYSGNRGGSFFTTDREWARQFTQSGRDNQIKKRFIQERDIFRPPIPIYAGDPGSVDAGIETARQQGFKAIWLDEGRGQPNSVYVFDRKALRFMPPYSTNQLRESQMKTFYHVTPHTRVKSILRDGLRLGGKRIWSNPYGGRLGSTQHIYLFSDLDAAIQLAAKLEWGIRNQRNPQVNILELQTDVPVEPDPSLDLDAQFRPGTWWRTDQPIPPIAIKQVIPLTLQMKRDFIARRDNR